MPEPPAPASPEPTADLRAVLDEELARLPEKLRVAVVLCDVEGHTREAAAQQLGVPVGTLSGRLTTAHRRLAALLERRGVACVPVVAGLAAAPLTAAVPKLLATITIKAGVVAATDGVTGSGAASSATELAQAVLAAMRAAKWKAPALLLLGAAVLVPGVALALQTPRPIESSTPHVESAKGDLLLVLERPAIAPTPRVKPQRHDPIVNNLNDIFVVSDLDEDVPDFFRHNRALVAPLSADVYRALAASKEPWVSVKFPTNSVNDPLRGPRGGRTVSVVPPSDAVRKLLDPVAAARPTFHAIVRQEGTAGLFDIVGYTDRPANDFFEQATPVTREATLTQKDLRYAEPAMVAKDPVPPLPQRSNQPSVLISSAIRERPGATDFRIATDRKESVPDYFRRNRVAVGCMQVSDYERLVRTAAPWGEVPVYPLSFNDQTRTDKRSARTVRITPPSAFMEARVYRPVIAPRPDIDAMTVVLRRDTPDGVFELVGWSVSRTAYQFFEKDVRLGDTGFSQRDLLYQSEQSR